MGDLRHPITNTLNYICLAQKKVIFNFDILGEKW